MKKYFESLKEYKMKIIKFENNKITLTNKEYEFYLIKQIVTFAKNV